MITFLIVYVLGCFASFGLIYLRNRQLTYSSDKTDLDVAFYISLFSWLMVIANLIMIGSTSGWFYRLNKRFKNES
jgi:hypothetical protein